MVVERKTLLQGSGIGKVFGGLAALENVDLTVNEGEIVGLIGPNGAGKTTFFNCLTGITIPSSGTINFMGVDLVPPPMINLMAQLAKMARFFIGISILWTFLVLATYLNSVAFQVEFVIAMLCVGAFRIFLGARLRHGVPWTRGVTLLFATLDAGIGAIWLVKFAEWYAHKSFFGFFPLEYLMIPAALIMISYPAYYFINLLRKDVKTLFGIFTRPDAVTQLGIARTFQNIRLFSNLSVMENVMLGRHCRTSTNVFSIILGTRFQRREERETRGKAMKTLKFVGLRHKAGSLAANLPYGEQRILEIARALATDPKVLLLDEPAAGMNPQETAMLIRLIDKIRDSGIAILLIEHDMKVIMKISDRIIVLDHGQKIAEGRPETIRSNRRVIEAYLGSAYAAQ